jgi:hypothetical protein
MILAVMGGERIELKKQLKKEREKCVCGGAIGKSVPEQMP